VSNPSFFLPELVTNPTLFRPGIQQLSLESEKFRLMGIISLQSPEIEPRNTIAIAPRPTATRWPASIAPPPDPAMDSTGGSRTRSSLDFGNYV